MQPSGAAVHSTVLALHAASYVFAPWHWALLSWQKMLAKLRQRCRLKVGRVAPDLCAQRCVALTVIIF
jgi:hypothetical protein